MACVFPRNSISNVVASVTIDADIYIYKMYIYVRDVAKRHETIVEGHKHVHVRIHVNLHLYLHVHIHIHLHLHLHFHLHIYKNM